MMPNNFNLNSIIKLNKIKDMIKTILEFIGLLCIIAVILGYPLMLLWNWLMPELFSLPIISFWQAIGLNILSSIIFKSSNYNKTN